ncbi:uncharacterized protein LOC129720445 [Wyeomyia smithii]|uniref:uncharacterized protein LOC129720445 n=1 Tax=Wyeomyia smithii TaxID=174621 RepID=UPI002467B60C|nr:uncharacterized protein LOC129720445 [Wyeomyia smithii]
MSKTKLAAFCRLCLVETRERVVIFPEKSASKNRVTILLKLVEILVNPDTEPGAVLCFGCLATLEEFYKFKEQCHENDQHIRSLHKKTNGPKSRKQNATKNTVNKLDASPKNFNKQYQAFCRMQSDKSKQQQDDETMESSDANDTVEHYINESEAEFDETPNSTNNVELEPDGNVYLIEAIESHTNDDDDDDTAEVKKVVKRTTKGRKRNSNHAKEAKPPKVTRRSVKIASNLAKARESTSKTENDYEEPPQFHLTVDPKVIGRSDFSNPVLYKSYPDFFHFEKGPRSINFSLVFYGERFNSAQYGVNYTYWQCTHRRKYSCDAVVVTTNDFTGFERRFHHTHEEIPVKEGIYFSPHEALPHIFKITRGHADWKRVAKQHLVRSEDRPNPDETAECSDDDELEQSKHNKDSSIEKIDKKAAKKGSTQPTKKKSKGKQQGDTVDILGECVVESLPVLDEMLVLADSYPETFHFEKGPRSTYFTLIYEDERYNSPLFTTRHTYWQCAHRRRYRCPAQVVVSNDYISFERRYDHSHDQLPAKDQTVYTAKEALPLIFEACKKTAYKVFIKKYYKTMDKKIRLASFCRLCLTKTQNRVPVFDDNNSVSHLLQLIEIEIDSTIEPNAVVCYDCVVTLEGFHQFKEQCHVNDDFVKNIPVEDEESNFSDDEQQQEHVDVSYAEDDEQSNPPDDPDYSQSSENVRTKRKASGSANLKNNAKKPKPVQDIDMEKIEKECAAYNVPTKATKPALEEMQVLAESYPDFFYFEKGHRSTYFSMIFYGEKYNSALYTERYTYWQCSHRKKYTCPAQVCVTNDYQTFERRYDHTHKDIRDKEGTLYTPLQALPDIFRTCREVVLRKRAQRRKKLLEKYKRKQSNCVQSDDDSQENTVKEEDMQSENEESKMVDDSNENNDYDYVVEDLDSSDDE